MSSKKILVMGNEAIALGAIRAGVRMAAGYPGTPSTEILETIAKHNDGRIHVEWSVNEKAAMEVGAGAAYAGARTLVTMKQVGLNVASDPLMSLAYMGVKGGMVIVSADDPGPISSQTEQDTRTFAQFSKLPVFDPSSPEEAYEMIGEAFEFSEKYQTPVLFRPTTRVCHACASIELLPDLEVDGPEGFVKDTMRWVIFPRTSYLNHVKIEKRNAELSETLSGYERNFILEGNKKKGIVTGGVSYAYTREVLPKGTPLLKISTPHPFPEQLAVRFLKELDEVLVLEELDPMIERELLQIVGRHHLPVNIYGKLTGHTKNAGENSTESIREDIARFLQETEKDTAADAAAAEEAPELPVRPPVLCAGCPHRASFYAVKKAMKGKKAVFSGDIGCYTLGAVAPLSAMEMTLCMGASVSSIHGFNKALGEESEGKTVAVIGDSTFMHSGMTGLANIAYNQSNSTVIILDNSITGMTGHQQNPTTGYNIKGGPAGKIDLESLCRAMGFERVVVVDPYDLEECDRVLKEELAAKAPSVIISRRPCVLLKYVKPKKPLTVDKDKCVGCKSCMRLGCPAISIKGGKAAIDVTLCVGCGVCQQLCNFDALQSQEVE